MTDKIQYYQPIADLQLSDHVYKTKIPGLYFISFDKYKSDRGFFSTPFIIPEIEQIIKSQFTIKQVNWSHSQTNTIRGIHAENWNKLVTVVSGKCLSVIVDINPDSKTYLQKEQFLFDEIKQSQKGQALFITAGLGNSLLALEGPVNYIYCVDQLYADRDKSGDQAINLFDPKLNINWPFKKEEMIISQRDLNAVNLTT